MFVLAATSLAVVTPALGQMQGIAVDNVTATNAGGFASSLSFDHTIGGGTNRYLVLAIGVNRFMSRTVDSVTYNGVALTQIGTETVGGGCASSIWTLGSAGLPVAGTYSVAISTSNSVNNIFASAISFTGVDQNNLPSSKQSNSSTTTNDPTVDITTKRAEYVVDGACLRSGSSSPALAVGPGQTQRSNQAASVVAFAVSNEPGVNLDPPSTGTTTMSWTGTLAGALNGWATSAIVIKPASTTAIRLSDLEVRRAARAAQVLWRTGFELDTLGFDIYRDDGFGPVRINRSPIVGSALRAGAGLTFSAGRIYRFDDRGAPPQPGTRYFLEEIDMDGRRSRHGPVLATAAPATAPPRLLAAPAPTSGAGPSLDLPAPPYAESTLVPAGPVGDIQRRLAAEGLVKIGIAKSGWYELDQQALVAAGLDGSVDPARLSLWQEGRQVPLWVRGHEDGRFDAGDGIGFHAQALDSPYTDTRIYWLGTGEGPAARLAPAGDHAGPEARTYPAVVEHHPREIYFSALQNGPEENFFGPTVSATPLSQRLPVADVAAATDHPFALTVGLQGVSTGDHRVQVAANGKPLGTLTLAGRARRSFDLTLPPALLTDGELEVTLTAGADGKDISLLDFLRLHYPRRLVAKSGRLWATLSGGVTAQVEGFGAGQRITAVDITEPHAPAWFFQTVAGPDGSARIPISGSGARRVFFADQAGALAPTFLARDTPSRLSQAPGADLVVVGPGSLLPAIAPLVERRQAEGWKVLTVSLEDVFDEFSFGVKHAGAIRAFVDAARGTWPAPPRALLLLGDASFDPRNLLGKGDFDLLPTRLVETRYMETAWDDWFTDFDDDGIADIPVGRLPARTGAELTVLVDKILGAPPAHAAAQAGALAVLAGADDDIHPFSLLARELAELAEAATGRGAVMTARQTEDATASQQALSAAIAQDPLLIAFAGHGSETQWAGGWLSNERVGELPAGSGRGGFWVALTCLNGFFHDIHQTSLAETLLFRPRGGAFGVWASSGVTGLPEQAAIGRGFLTALLEGGISVGEAAARAKRLTTDPDVRRTWVLLGDPSWTWPAARAPSADGGPRGEQPNPPPDAGATDGSLDPGASDGASGVDAAPAAESAGGCGCRTGSAPSRSGGWSLGSLALAILMWRRRRPGPGR